MQRINQAHLWLAAWTFEVTTHMREQRFGIPMDIILDNNNFSTCESDCQFMDDNKQAIVTFI
jgi:hypothetical protein